MSYVKIWVHIVWSTKHRQPLLNSSVREILCQHIRHNAQLKDIWLEDINGYDDHLHVLIRLQPDQSISKVVQLLKGESAYWTNQQRVTSRKLVWSKEYFAVSVSESGINRLKQYIANQPEHHRRKTFADEYEEFINVYGFARLKDADD